MIDTDELVLSLVVPVYNEAEGLIHFHDSLVGMLRQADLLDMCEIIYCDDGSTDTSKEVLTEIASRDNYIKTIIFSRNFGKENALAAGIGQAKGQAIITLDSDEQHPVELIPSFIEAWRGGAKVVVGIRKTTHGNWFKRAESQLFYTLFNRLSGQKLIPGSTDFRLIDRSVQTAFLSLPESNRITRGLIDWLGFERAYIFFEPKERHVGTPNYSHRKLIELAMNSLVSLSPRPLFLLGYLGAVTTGLAFILGTVVIVERFIFNDPFGWRITGTAMLGILMIFFIGIILISQGVLAIYISHIHTESKRRPLYVIDWASSKGIGDK